MTKLCKSCKECEEDGCNTHPSFNFENEKKARFCASHKEENMVNVISKKCEFENCKIYPTFNFKNEKTRRFCTTHKEENMISIVSNCNYNECNKTPYFNFKNEKTRRFCTIHKEENMIDIKSYLCKNDGCYTIGNKKYEGYCARCFPKIQKNATEITIHDFNLEGFSTRQIYTDWKSRLCIET